MKTKVIIMQGLVQAPFYLSDKELENLRKDSIYTAQEKEKAMKANSGRIRNTAMYVFFDHYTTRGKAKRFHGIFSPYKGDFTWVL